MSHNPRHRHGDNRRNKPRDLRIGWANLGRGSQQHDTILNLAFEEEIEVLCVQEPWTAAGTKTKSHPAFHKFAPLDAWEWDDLEERETVRPRVLTYVRKESGLDIQQRRPVDSRDLLWVTVNGYSILNIYREPGKDAVLDYILSLVPPSKCLIGGDFNVHNEYFEPGVDNYARGGELVNWITHNQIDYIGEVGIATHNRGHVLDLTLSNIPAADSVIRMDMHCGSDHETQVTTIPSRGTVPLEQHHYRVTESDLPKLAGLVEVGMAALGSPRDLCTEIELDNYAKALAEIFSTAIETVGKVDRGGGNPATWWTQECRDAHRAYLATKPADGETTLEKRNFLTVVRRAKREYWRKIIDGAIDDAALYKVIGWHKGTSDLRSPPLKIGDQVIENSLDKAEALRADILERFSPEDDLEEDPLDTYGYGPYAAGFLPWEQSVSAEEVEKSTIGVSSTSPGPDMITVRLLRACWGAVKHQLTDLFNKCLEHSFFPDTWKAAEVAMIPKVGKKERWLPRAWRPIALLSCVSKGFERIVAKRIAWTALAHGVLSPQHGGALPKRSAMDLVASLTHDLELALESGYQATVVTMDVMGAFDALLRNRLLLRMIYQGWPLALLLLVRSFLTKRRVRVRVEGSTTHYRWVLCGTPQGSPLSPILYMLYLAELLNQDRILRFGYADDLCLYRVSKSLEENAELLAADIEYINTWGQENKVIFAPEKTEMIHLTRKKGPPAPTVPLRDGKTLVPITTADKPHQKPALKWLGVWFDQKLRFRRHVQERVSKARKVAHHIRSLGRTKDGPPASSLHKAVTTCVLSSVIYGNEAWYGGKNRIAGYKRDGTAKWVGTRIGSLVEMVGSALALAARGVLPIWRTTPLTTLYRDSGLPAPDVALEDAQSRFALRLQTVDENHPLVRRIKHKKRAVTKLQRAGQMLPKILRPELRTPHFSPGCRTNPTGGDTKEAAAKKFEAWWRNVSANDILIFSDGSEQYKQGRKGVGYGYAIYRDRRKIADGKATISTDSHVFDAEAIGAWEGLKRAIHMPESRGQKIWMCIDSTSVIWCMRGNAAESSQWAFHLCQDAMQLHDIGVKWSPGHMGIEGNGEADWLADLAANPDTPTWATDTRALQPTTSGVRSQARMWKRSAAEIWWAQKEPNLSERYKRWELRYKLGPLKELDLPRATLHRLLAARSGHGDFKWYHVKYKHEDAILDCTCGRAKTPSHIVFCRKNRETFASWPLKPASPPKNQTEGQAYLQKLLASPKDFADFLEVTACYTGTHS